MAARVGGRRGGWTVPAAAAAAALALVATAGADSRRSETATLGNVAATLTYLKRDDFGYRDTSLAIRRGGRVVYSKPVPHCGACEVWPANQGRSKSVSVRDVDRSGEPEVVVETYTGGAHCCLMLHVFAWNGRAYAGSGLDAGSAGYRWADLDGDGRTEWIATDTRFESLFTAYANSLQPIRIVTYRRGAFVPVTRSYRPLIRKDEREARRLYLRYRGTRDVRGVLAAWAADKYLLGEGAAVWPELALARSRGQLRAEGFGPAGAAYVAALRAALARFGYTKLG